ncbi:MAG: TetR/AcrR family transcriptional regulator [Desulfitobacteriaceae bacterium]
MQENKVMFNFPWEGEGNPYGPLTEKQWKILRAALEVFIEKGYSAATTSEIAHRAGVAEGTIFRHFKTKKDILLATLVPLMQNLLGPGVAYSLRDLLVQNGNLPLEEVLLIILEDRQKHIAEISGLLRVVLVEANFHPELKEVLVNEVAGKSQEFLLRFLEQRQKAGELRGDIDVWALTRSLVGAFAFYLFSQGLFPMREEGRDNRQELKAMVDLFLKGAQTKN